MSLLLTFQREYIDQIRGHGGYDNPHKSNDPLQHIYLVLYSSRARRPKESKAIRFPHRTSRILLL